MILTPNQVRSISTPIYNEIFPNKEIPHCILLGQISVESSNNTNAFANDSNGGSYGLMQIDKVYLSYLGFNPNLDLFDPETNLRVGFTYMKKLYYGEVGNVNIDKLTDNVLRVAMSLFSFNCGPGNFQLMYRNHLSDKPVNYSWNEYINNMDIVSNWKSCIQYPVKVFHRSYELYDLIVTKVVNNSLFSTSVCLIDKFNCGG